MSSLELDSDEKKDTPKKPERIDFNETRKVLVLGRIEVASVKDVIKDILVQATELSKSTTEEKKITLIIGSEGGEALAGFDIIGAIRQAQLLGIRVLGVVHSHAESMGLLILQACNTRVIYSTGFLMVHGYTFGFHGDQRDFDAEQKINNHLIDIAAKMLSNKTPEYDYNHWYGVMKDNNPLYFTPDEALAVGLVDTVRDD